jgi:hypothetical protein
METTKAPHTENGCSLFSCKFCDYKSTRAYNVLRHTGLKHANRDVVFGGDNVVFGGDNVVFGGNDVVFGGTPDATASVPHQNQCEACKKPFLTQWNLDRHKLVCKGAKITPFACEICEAMFTLRSSKSRHMKTCKAKSVTTINNTTHNTTTNTNCHNNSHNTTHNQINLIVFDPNDMRLLNDHIDIDELKKIMLDNPDDQRDVMRRFGRAILRRPENRCVQKKTLRHAHSKVHVGDDKWEARLDTDVYPKLTSNIADNLTELMHSRDGAKGYRIFKQMFRTFFPYAEAIAGDGYNNSKDEELNQRILRDFKTLARDMKLIVATTDEDDAVGK